MITTSTRRCRGEGVRPFIVSFRSCRESPYTIDPQLNFIRFLLRPHLASETGKATNILARSECATIRNFEAPPR